MPAFKLYDLVRITNFKNEIVFGVITGQGKCFQDPEKPYWLVLAAKSRNGNKRIANLAQDDLKFMAHDWNPDTNLDPNQVLDEIAVRLANGQAEKDKWREEQGEFEENILFG